MLVVDNSVLSSFRFINALQLLSQLNSQIVTSELIANEFTSKWFNGNIPQFIKIITPIPNPNIFVKSDSLSKSDVSILSISKVNNALLCTDDLRLRKEAAKHNIKIIGSIGLLKLLYKKNSIKSKKEYLKYLEKIQEDLHLSEGIINWAKKDL